MVAPRTYGIPVVDEVHTAAGISELTLLEAAAAAERNSEHPLGRAIVRYAEGKSIQASPPESFEYRIGRGILASAHGEPIAVGNRLLFSELGITMPEQPKANCGTEVFVVRNGRYLDSLAITISCAPAPRLLSARSMR